MFIAHVDGLLQSFLSDSPPNPLRGLEHTSLIVNAKRFDSADEVAAFVTARGGAPSRYQLWAVPS